MEDVPAATYIAKSRNDYSEDRMNAPSNLHSTIENGLKKAMAASDRSSAQGLAGAGTVQVPDWMIFFGAVASGAFGTVLAHVVVYAY